MSKEELEEMEEVEEETETTEVEEETKPTKDMSYQFATFGDVKNSIKEALEQESKNDPYFASKYQADKMDSCYEWLIEQIKDFYISKFKKVDGGIEISNEQCFMACRHYFLEELYKYKPLAKKSSNKAELTPEQKTANVVKKHEKAAAKKEDNKPKEKAYENMNIFDFLNQEG